MSVSPLSDPGRLAGPPPAALAAARTSAPPGAPSFAATLDREEAREAATKLVASALVLPALESLRDGPFSDGPFAPGAAERRFAPLLDQHLADRITSASRFALPDLIVDRLLAGRSTT